jgi:hypothetical protein
VNPQKDATYVICVCVWLHEEMKGLLKTINTSIEYGSNESTLLLLLYYKTLSEIRHV